MSRIIGMSKSASMTTVSLCSRSYRDPCSMFSMTSIGHDASMTAPITVVILGCRSLASTRISATKSCNKFRISHVSAHPSSRKRGPKNQ